MRVKTAKLKGQLIDRDAPMLIMERVIVAARTHALGLPDALSDQLADLSDRDQVRAVLEEAIDKFLSILTSSLDDDRDDDEAA